MTSPNLRPDRPLIAKRPAYRQVMDAMIGMVKGKAPGERLGTEGDFVRQFGVSLVTVRQALARLENDGVIERRQGIGTFVPVDPLPRRHVAVHLETSPTHPFLSPYFLKLHEEVRKVLQARGHSCRSYFGDSAPEEALSRRFSCTDLLVDYRLERLSAAISIGAGPLASELERFGKLDIPVFDARARQQFSWNRKTAFLREALTTLRAQGRQRIAILAWENPALKVKPFHAEVIRVAQECDIEINEHYLDLNASALEQGMGWERFRDLWRGSARKPDGLVVLDDMIFDDCQKAICELGLRVPEQLGIFLYTSDAKRLNPVFPITCYRLMTAVVAEHYVEALEALMRGETPPAREPNYEIVHLPGNEASDESPFQPSQPYLLNL